MAGSLIEKLTNFLAPLEEIEDNYDDADKQQAKPRSNLRLHSTDRIQMHMAVVYPNGYDDVRLYADQLKSNYTLVVNFERVDMYTQRCMCDFLDGVCYVLDGSSEKVSERIIVYTPANISISKELFAYSIPTYVKHELGVK